MYGFGGGAAAAAGGATLAATGGTMLGEIMLVTVGSIMMGISVIRLATRRKRVNA